jgi:hypothetical protein
MNELHTDWLKKVKDKDVINQFNRLRWKGKKKPISVILDEFKKEKKKNKRTIFVPDPLDARSELYKILTSFPQTGLYGEIDLNIFRQFIMHIFSIFEGSPRNQMIHKINKKVSEMSKDPEVHTFYKDLKCSPKPHMFDLANAFYRLSPGKRYQKIIDCEIRCNILLDQLRPEFLEEIKQKIYLNPKNRLILNEKLDFKIKVQMAVLEGRKRHKLNTKIDEMTLHWAKLQGCSVFKKWMNIQTQWDKYGFEDIINKFTLLEHSISHQRRKNGDAFELEHQTFAVKEVSKRLGHQLEDLKIYTNVNWVKNRRHIGEVDIVLVKNKRVICLIEMKAHSFHITKAFEQHKTKITDPSCSLVINDQFKWSLIPGDEPPALFVVTCKSPRDYMFGCDPNIFKIIGNELYHLPERTNIFNCDILLMRFAKKIKNGIIQKSPEQVLLDNWDNIIYISEDR